MIFSKPAEYAIHALAELALMSDNSTPRLGRAGHYVVLSTLVERTTLPREFLAKILGQLAQAHVLQSAKGPHGGFALARPAHEISLLDIVEAVRNRRRVEDRTVSLAQGHKAMPYRPHDLFKPIRQKICDYLSSTTLADIAVSPEMKKTRKPKKSRSSKRGAVAADQEIRGEEASGAPLADRVCG